MIFFIQVIDLKPAGENILFIVNYLFSKFIYIVFIFNVSDYLLEHIFQSDHTRGPSEFIHNQCYFSLLYSKYLQQPARRHRFGYNRKLFDPRPDLSGIFIEILKFKITGNMINSTLVNKN